MPDYPISVDDILGDPLNTVVPWSDRVYNVHFGDGTVRTYSMLMLVTAIAFAREGNLPAIVRITQSRGSGVLA